LIFFSVPCSSLALWRDIIIGGYGDGQIRLYCAKTAKLAATINAHARWVNAIDIAPETGRVLSVSEDTFVKVWQLKEGNLPEVLIITFKLFFQLQVIRIRCLSYLIFCDALTSSDILYGVKIGIIF
jgi:WD40 repeat protein